jgi:hypothetical protein
MYAMYVLCGPTKRIKERSNKGYPDSFIPKPSDLFDSPQEKSSKGNKKNKKVKMNDFSPKKKRVNVVMLSFLIMSPIHNCSLQPWRVQLVRGRLAGLLDPAGSGSHRNYFTW